LWFRYTETHALYARPKIGRNETDGTTVQKIIHGRINSRRNNEDFMRKYISTVSILANIS
jgi:hypothetical protein